MNVTHNNNGTINTVTAIMSPEEYVEFAKYLGGLEQPQTTSSQSNPSNLTLVQTITNTLNQLGVPRHVKGFEYIREAITLATVDVSYIHNTTKKLYPTLARKFNDTPSRVERAIRHAIEITWNRGSVETINSLFGNTVNFEKSKPTNGEFLALLSDNMRLFREVG
jgi:two-component system response regulator (stage 0 sporulation protein A)